MSDRELVVRFKGEDAGLGKAAQGVAATTKKAGDDISRGLADGAKGGSALEQALSKVDRAGSSAAKTFASVDRAALAVSKAQARAADAADDLARAQSKAEAIQKRHKAGSSAVEDALRRVAAASRQVEIAQEEAQVTQKELTRAQESATKAQQQLVSSQREVAAAQERTNRAAADSGEKIRRGADKGSGGMKGLGAAIGGVSKLFAPLLAAAAGFQALDWAKGAVEKASDLGESMSKVSQIFGDEAARAIEQFASKGPKALGQTKLAVLDAAGTFGVFGKSAGLTGEKLAGFSNGLVQLATDLASFHNTSPEEAVEALAAALRGETEPMRKYGVLLDDASMRQEALRLGLVKTTKEALNPQQKVLAAQALIMRQTKDAQGDFAKTSGGLANQQRILAASFEETQAKVGQLFLPIVNKAVVLLNEKALPAIGKITDGVGAFFNLLVNGDYTGALSDLFGIEEDSGLVAFLLDARQGVADFFATWEKGAAAFDPGKLTGSLAGLLDVDRVKRVGGAWAEVIDKFREPVTGGIPDWVTNSLLPSFERFGGTVQDAWAKVQPILDDISVWLAGFLADHEPEISFAAQQIGDIVTGLVDLVGGTLQVWADNAAKFWNDWGWLVKDVVGAVFDRVVKIVGGALEIVSGLIETITGVITGDWDKAWSGLQKTFQGIWDTLVGVVTGGAEQMTDIARHLGVVDALAGHMRWVRDKWKEVQGFLEKPVQAGKDAIGKGVELIGSAFDRLREFAAKPIRFVINTVFNDGIRAVFNTLAQTFGSDMRIPPIVAGFDGGGWTGPGSRMQPAGIVHADEFVINKASRGRFEQKFPGYLKHINETGTLPGFAGGGWVKPINAQSSGWNGGRYSSGKWHGGLDFPAPTGTLVVSPGAGVVAAKQALETSYGHHYQLAMANGYRVILAHLSKLNALPTVGMPVLPGMPLGLSGSTGNSTGPHLHFEVIPPGGSHLSAVDPSNMIGGYAAIPGIGDVAKFVMDKFAAPLDQLGGLGDSPVGQIARAIPRKAVALATDAIKSGLGLVRDSGGPLPQGPSLVLNHTGRQEWVLTGEQMDRILSLLEQRSMTVTVTPDYRGFRDLIIAVLDEVGVDTSRASGQMVGGAA